MNDDRQALASSASFDVVFDALTQYAADLGFNHDRLARNVIKATNAFCRSIDALDLSSDDRARLYAYVATLSENRLVALEATKREKNRAKRAQTLYAFVGSAPVLALAVGAWFAGNLNSPVMGSLCVASGLIVFAAVELTAARKWKYVKELAEKAFAFFRA